jgi:RimJ/RimL family protein N-acetyltransferase
MAKKIISPIGKNYIKIRLLEESDLPLTLAWRNQDHIRKWFVHPAIISWNQHQEWFEIYKRSDNDYLFIIEETRRFNKPVGQISLYNIEWDKKCAEFGRLMIGAIEAQGKGIAKKASCLMLNFAFNELELTQVTLEVFGDNKPALAIYHACGFKEISETNRLKKMLLDKNLFLKDQ